MEGFADSMKCAVTDNITQPAWPQIEETLNEHLGEALYGDISGDEAVKESAKRGEELIKTSNG
jgi:ABC-type glycerol-3-phosphate transport system substrate-binding protein